MIIYHGSNLEIKNPDIHHSRNRVDFGKGFYVTIIYEQAKHWTAKFSLKGEKAVISKYEFDEAAYKDCKVVIFDSYSELWLDFILNCRSGIDKSNYDIVVGCVANDNIFNTIELFFDGLIDKYEAIKRLKYEKPNQQLCFRNQSAIDKYIKFLGSEIV